METKVSFARRMAVIATVIIGALIFSYGLYLYSWRDAQIAQYNQGIAAYRSGDHQVAVKYFDTSLSTYKGRQDLNWMERFIYPKPDKELAALASFHKAKSLLRLNQAPPAVQAFKESLELNSGNLYLGRDLTEKEYQVFREAAMVVKYNLELLFKNDPQQAQKQGKGKGKGNGPPQDGKPVPGDDPGSMPGKGNRDTI
jgi:tetratricopeptide (TPR) repeat protein